MKFDAVVPYDCDHMTVNMLKADFDSGREHDIESHIESQDGKSPGPHCYADDEAFVKGDQNKGERMEASYSLSAGKIGLARKDTDFCTEKAVIEIGLPEMTDCFMDGDCQTVKDICVDDGAHSLEKVFIETNEGEKLPSRIHHFVSNGNYSPTKGMTDNTKEMMDVLEPIALGLKSSSINKQPSTDDGAVQCSSGSSLTHGGKSEPDAPPVAFIEEQLRSLLELDTDPWEVNSSSFHCINEQKQYIALQKFDQGTLKEGNSTDNAVPFVAEEASQSNGSKESPGSSEAGVITLDFESGVATVSRDNDSKGNTEQQSGQGHYSPKPEEATFDGATVSARSSFVFHCHGDLNFYGPASLSGPTASSGHIPYSGSISLRSDSSTTSARSFAFPTLQNEWNSSPIKMAKADRRRSRKRGWRMALLCCRF